MKGSGVISALKRKFRVSTDRALADRIGITVQAVQNWKSRDKVTERQTAGVVYKASRAGARTLQARAIRPLVEFFRIQRCEAKRAKTKYTLFDTRLENGNEQLYRAGLRKELEDHRGVYIFFDSRGQAIYTGKARRQSLWKEMNLAYNRAASWKRSGKSDRVAAGKPHEVQRGPGCATPAASDWSGAISPYRGVRNLNLRFADEPRGTERVPLVGSYS